MARNEAGVTVRAVRRIGVLETRVQGRSLRAIVGELGCASATAMRDLHHALGELARRNHLLAALADKIDADDVAARCSDETLRLIETIIGQ